MPPAVLFIRNVLVRNWRFLAVTMASCMVAATVATFQYAVYNSFPQASTVVPRVRISQAAHVWTEGASARWHGHITAMAQVMGVKP